MTVAAAERELAEALADLEDLLARPVESFGHFPMGTKLHGVLSIYPEVTPVNIRAALALQQMYCCTYAREINEEWASWPEDVRLRVRIEAVLIRAERAVAELERMAAEKERVHACR